MKPVTFRIMHSNYILVYLAIGIGNPYIPLRISCHIPDGDVAAIHKTIQLSIRRIVGLVPQFIPKPEPHDTPSLGRIALESHQDISFRQFNHVPRLFTPEIEGVGQVGGTGCDLIIPG